MIPSPQNDKVIIEAEQNVGKCESKQRVDGNSIYYYTYSFSITLKLYPNKRHTHKEGYVCHLIVGLGLVVLLDLRPKFPSVG